jgi:Kef-type K+ transport system membrane component KefB
MVVLAIVTAIFRPVGRERFALPPLGWVFLQVGMGACLGFLLLAARANARSHNERSALTFGGVAFSAGMAQYIGFSPLVVTFCAGVIVASLRDREQDDFAAMILSLERPIYLTFFALVGATWSVANARVLVLLAAFVAARTAAKILAPRVRPLTNGPPPTRVAIALLPSSVVSVAVVVTTRNLYPDFDPLFESVVLFGALFAELFTQLAVLWWKRNEPPPPELELSDTTEDEEALL